MLNPGQIRIFNIPLIFLVFLILTGCDLYKDAKIFQNGHVQVTVYDRSTGEPVPGAEIFVESPENLYYNYDVSTSTYFLERYCYIYRWHSMVNYEPDNNYQFDIITDNNGKCLIRNLPDDSTGAKFTSEYYIVTTKWPGFKQNITSVNPEELSMIEVDIFLDSADAQFSVNPLSLHFQSGQTRESLVITNEGNIPLYWEVDEDWDYVWWFNYEYDRDYGALSPYDSKNLGIYVKRDSIDTFPAYATISIEVLSTGEKQEVHITIDQ